MAAQFPGRFNMPVVTKGDKASKEDIRTGFFFFKEKRGGGKNPKTLNCFFAADNRLINIKPW